MITVGTHDWPGRRLLGRPNVEWPTIGIGTTTGTKLIIMGDFGTGCKIVDRLGKSAELIPHMMCATRLPVSAAVLLLAARRRGDRTNALRYLEVK